MALNRFQMDPVSPYSASWLKLLSSSTAERRVYKIVANVAAYLKGRRAAGLEAILAQNNYFERGTPCAVGDSDMFEAQVTEGGSCTCYYDEDGEVLYRDRSCTFETHTYRD